MSDLLDVQEVLGCHCLGTRRLARQLTLVYEQVMAPTGLTVGQFGLMAQLQGAAQHGSRSVPPRRLAERLGTDPTTVSRTLQPLFAAGFVTDDPDPQDRRTRAIRLTDKGQRKLQQAMPLWRKAHRQTTEMLGAETAAALKSAVGQSIAHLAS
jgi:DNA-binding MarR family transcriptional regulator